MRRLGFYLLLGLPAAIWALIVISANFDSTAYIAENIIDTTLRASPIMGGDLSIFGEVTPVILAGSIIALMPPEKGDVNIIAVVLAIIIYALFIHLNVYFSSGPGEGLISSVTGDTVAGKKKILAIVSNVRVMAIVIAASILGYKFKRA